MFGALLASRDYQIADLSAGVQSEDILAIDSSGQVWCVEVKNTATITPAHKRQAINQAARRGQSVRWMLANKIEGSSSWLVRRQGERPAVWHQDPASGEPS